MTHGEAVALTLQALGDQPKATAVVRLVLGLAAVLDENPFSEPEIWREYRMALKALMEVAGGDEIDDNVKDLLERLGGTDVRNAPDGG